MSDWAGSTKFGIGVPDLGGVGQIKYGKNPKHLAKCWGPKISYGFCWRGGRKMSCRKSRKKSILSMPMIVEFRSEVVEKNAPNFEKCDFLPM